MNRAKIISLLVLLTISIFSASSASKSEKKNAELKDGLYAQIQTEKGNITLVLEYEKTPMTVTNFVALAEGNMTEATRKGRYFDGLNFHRVIGNFMIQGGCPEGSGRGNPGYRFEDEFDPSLKHDKAGILSMANAGPGTNGSQFFITHGPTPHLDGKHAVFGHVVDGMDVVNSIAVGDKINRVEIIRVGEKAKKFVADQKIFNKLRATAKKRAAEKFRQENLATIQKIEDEISDPKVSDLGVYYKIEKEGTGNKPAKGNTVAIHYTGTLLNGTVFDSSVKRGEPIEFPIGMGYVIQGWDEAGLDMKVGEKRVVYIPPHLGYGPRGSGPIPPNSWLKFEMELVEIK